MEKFRFLNWNVYKDARELFSAALVLTRKLPKEFRFELGSQIIRSAFSVVLNIAEGSGKTSDKELNRFIEIALGSVSETLAAVDILHFNQLITEEDFGAMQDKLFSISNQLGGFKKHLK